MDIEKAAQDIFEENHESVVMVVRRSGSTRKYFGGGTGFIIGGRVPSYLVMTAKHVIKDDPKFIYAVRLPRETTEYEAKLLHGCLRSDIGMIEVIGVTRVCRPLQFRDSYNLACQAVVFQLGYIRPDNLDGTSQQPAQPLFPAVSPLRISKPHRRNGLAAIEDIVCTGASRTGASGSPIILGHEVIGVIVSCQLGTEVCAPGTQVLIVRPSELIHKVLQGWLQLPPNDSLSTDSLIQLFCKKLPE